MADENKEPKTPQNTTEEKEAKQDIPKETPVSEDKNEPKPQEERKEEAPQEKEKQDEQAALEHSKDPQRTKKYIDKLKEEKTKYKNVLDSLRPKQVSDTAQKKYEQPIKQAPSAAQFPGVSQQDINNVFQGMVDEEGYVDGQKLMNIIVALGNRTVKAERDAKEAKEDALRIQTDAEEERKSEKVKALHEKYPMLNPKAKEGFNRSFYEAVRNDMVGQMVDGKSPPGKEDPMKSADKLYPIYYNENVNKKEKEELKKTKDTKKQINAVRPRSSSQAGYYKAEEEKNLRKKVQQGKKGALAEMLRRHEEKNK